jgi:hypothetical protein
MPRTRRTLTPIVLAAVAAILAGYAAFAGNGDATTGQFLVAIAKEASVNAGDPVTAAQALRSAGYALPNLDLDKQLTEGTVAAIANSLGLNVTTQQPGAAFGSAQVAAFVDTFGRDLGSRAGSQPGIKGTDPSTKGKKKGHNKSNSEPI